MELFKLLKQIAARHDTHIKLIVHADGSGTARSFQFDDEKNSHFLVVRFHNETELVEGLKAYLEEK